MYAKHIVVTRKFTNEDAGVFTFLKGFLNFQPEYLQSTVRERGNGILTLLSCSFHSTRSNCFVSVHCIWSLETLFATLLPFKRDRVMIFPHGMLESWCIKGSPWKMIFIYLLKLFESRLTFIVLSRQELESVKKLFEKARIKQINPFVETNKADISEESARIVKTVVSIGRYEQKKGLDYLIRAICQSKDAKIATLRFDFYGFGEESYINYLREEASNATNISINGRIDNDKKWKVLKECGALILPSHSENFGYVIPEALSMGCKVIVSKNTPWVSNLPSSFCIPIEEISEKQIERALKLYVKNHLNSNEFSRKEIVSYYDANFAENIAIQSYKELFNDKTEKVP